MNTPPANEDSPHGRLIVWMAIGAGICIFLFGIYVAFGRSFENRRHVTIAIGESAELRASLNTFRRGEGRWPRADEARRFRVDPARLKNARSIEYSADLRGVVVTMGREPYAGRSFAFLADDSTPPHWTCKTIDLDVSYMPDPCR